MSAETGPHRSLDDQALTDDSLHGGAARSGQRKYARPFHMEIRHTVRNTDRE